MSLFYSFSPFVMWKLFLRKGKFYLRNVNRSIRSTNAIESVCSNVRQRTDQIDVFTTETSCLTIVWAVMQDIRLPRIPVDSKRNTACSWCTSNQPKRMGQEEVMFFATPV
jgi:transposase-like protein